MPQWRETEGLQQKCHNSIKVHVKHLGSHIPSSSPNKHLLNLIKYHNQSCFVFLNLCHISFYLFTQELVIYLCSGAKRKDSARKDMLRTALPQKATAAPRMHSRGETRRGQSCPGPTALWDRSSKGARGKMSTAGRPSADQPS